MARLSSHRRAHILCGLLTLPLVSCEPAAVENAIEDASHIADEVDDGSVWTIETKVDPLTDAESMIATATFDVDPFKIYATVKCTDHAKLIYKFDSYSQNGDAAPLRFYFMPTPIGPSQNVGFQYRVDQNPPVHAYMRGLAYTNELVVGKDGVERKDYASEMGSADHVVIKIPLQEGEVIVEWDQSDAKLRSVIDPCLTAVNEKADPALENAADTAGNPDVASTADVVNTPDGQRDLNGNRPAELSSAEVASLANQVASQIRRCYRVPSDISDDARDIETIFRLRFKRDGTFASPPQLMRQSGVRSTSGADADLLLKAAERALDDCVPLNLPADQYEGGWEDIEMTF